LPTRSLGRRLVCLNRRPVITASPMPVRLAPRTETHVALVIFLSLAVFDRVTPKDLPRAPNLMRATRRI
jgi:hypothetical protein